jgi:hypothetical protein
MLFGWSSWQYWLYAVSIQIFVIVFFWDTFVAFSIGSRRLKSWLNKYVFRIE